MLFLFIIKKEKLPANRKFDTFFCYFYILTLPVFLSRPNMDCIINLRSKTRRITGFGYDRNRVSTILGHGRNRDRHQTSGNMSFVYILESVHFKKYYVGCTDNLKSRLVRHNSGLVFWTKRYKPWTLVYYEEYQILSQARKREKQIKSWHKRKNIENLIKKAAFV